MSRVADVDVLDGIFCRFRGRSSIRQRAVVAAPGFLAAGSARETIGWRESHVAAALRTSASVSAAMSAL